MARCMTCLFQKHGKNIAQPNKKNIMFLLHNKSKVVSCRNLKKIKLKLKVLQMTDEGKMKSPTWKLKKKNKGISSKHLTKLITGNYWMRPIMIWRFKCRSWKGVIYRQIFTQLDQIFNVVWGLRFRDTLSVSTFMKKHTFKIRLNYYFIFRGKPSWSSSPTQRWTCHMQQWNLNSACSDENCSRIVRSPSLYKRLSYSWG